MRVLMLVALLGLWLAPGSGNPVPPVPTRLPGTPPQLGPRPNETRRFLYKDEAIGRTHYCMWCPLKAVLDSTYIDMQQGLCFGPYKDKNWTTVLTPYEYENQKFPICNTVEESETPGCGQPDLNVSWAEWHCEKGFNGELHAVYTPCQLACSIGKAVVAQVYCNESLIWHVDFREDVQCAEPTTTLKPTADKDAERPQEPTTSTNTTIDGGAPGEGKELTQDSNLQIILYVVASVGAGIIVATIVVCFCYCRRKRSPSQQSSLEDMMELQQRQNGGVPALRPPTAPTVAPTRTPRWKGSASTIGNCSIVPSMDGNIDNLTRDEEEAAEGNTRVNGRGEDNEAEHPVSAACDDLDDSRLDRRDGSRSDSRDDGEDDTGVRSRVESRDESRVDSQVDSPASAACDDDDDDNGDEGFDEDENDPLLPEEGEDDTEGSNPLRKSDKSKASVQSTREAPDVKVFHSNQRESLPENRETCRIQKNAYSVKRGSTFHIVPSSPNGVEITDFVVLRKDGGRYRGRVCPEFNLDFFHTVENANDEDADVYTWYIRLENGEQYQRDFQIFIARGEDPPANAAPESALQSSQVTAPESAMNSVNNSATLPDDTAEAAGNGNSVDADNEVAEHNVEFDSGNKSDENQGPIRPEPLGAEDDPVVRSAVGGKSPLVQVPVVPGPVAPAQQAQRQQAVPANLDSQDNDLDRSKIPVHSSADSVPHLNIYSSSLPNSQQPLVGHGPEHKSIGTRDDRGVGQSGLGSNCAYNANVNGLRGELNQNSSVSYNRRNLGPEVSQNARIGSLHPSSILNSGENSAIPHISRNSGDVVPQFAGIGHLNPSSILDSGSAVDEPHNMSCGHNEDCVIDHVSPLNANSIEAPSCMRSEPPGASREEPLVENPRQEMMESDIRNLIDDCADYCDDVDNDRHQTHRKQPAEVLGCTTWLRDVTDERYLEKLCNLADPRDNWGNRRTWYGFASRFGIPEHKLRAIEYHRRGFIHDGPTRTVLRELGGRLRMCDLVKYFLQNDRQDIVDLSIDDCPDHVNCQYCIRLRNPRTAR